MMFKRQSWLLGFLHMALWAGLSWVPPTQAAETTDNCWVCPIELQPEVFFVQGLAALGSSSNRNFISNAGFVITQDRVVVIDALATTVVEPGWTLAVDPEGTLRLTRTSRPASSRASLIGLPMSSVSSSASSAPCWTIRSANLISARLRCARPAGWRSRERRS